MAPNLQARLNHQATNFALPLIFWIVFAAQSGAAQTTGDLVGQVRDPGGKGLRDVTVKVVNTVNGIGAATKTNDRGDFVVPDLSPGDYRIVATKENYRPVCQPVLSILLDRKNPVPAPHIKFGSAGNDPACRNLKVQSSRRNPDARAADPLAGGGGPEAAEAGDRGPYVPSAIIVVLEREPDDISTESDSQQGNPAANAAPAVSDAPIGSVVNTVDATRGSNFTAKQIEALPLGAASYMRTFDDLALLAPGVAPPPYTPGVRGPGVGFGIGTAGQFSVNGARARSNNFSVDGSDTNDPDVGVRRGGYVAQVPQSLESIQEVSISTLLWSAQLGRNSGSQVNAVSKYGGNDFHGQVYGFFNDSRLNARNFFDYTGGASGGKDPFTRTQAGFVIGGPIVREKTQFFGGFEGTKINASTEQHFSSPTLNERRQGAVEDFSPGGEVSGLISPVSRGQLNFFPVPNSPGGPFGHNTYTELLPADGSGVISSVKFTHQVTERHTLNARYNFTDDHRVLPSVNQAIHSTIEANTRSQTLAFMLDSQITSRLFNQARFSFGRTRGDFPEHQLGRFNPSGTIFNAPNGCGLLPNGRLLCGGIVVVGVTQAIGEVIIEPYNPVGVNALLFPQGRVNNTFQYADTWSWHWHDHSFKFGADLRRVQLNSFQDRLYRPQISFGYGLGELGHLEVSVQDDKFKPRFTPQGNLTALSGLELGLLMPTSALQTLTAGVPDSHIGLRIAEYHFFLNDHWRLRSNLTLNYGLRYEYNSVPHDSHDRIEDALTLRSLPAPGEAAEPDIRMRYERVINAYRKVLDGRTGIYDPDRNNFGPCVGFAWDPLSDGKTALRGGYGIYYDAMLGAIVSQSRSVFPNEVPVGVDRPQPGYLNLPASCSTVVCIPTGDLSFAIKTNQLQGGPGAFVQNIATLSDEIRAGLAFTLPAKNLPTPSAQQWHMTFEREIANGFLVSAAYVGTKGIKLTRLVTPNLGPSSTPFSQIAITRTPVLSLPEFLGDPSRPGVLLDSVRFLQPASRPVPELGTYQIFENSARSGYHALQLEASRRYHHDFNFTFAYTWSHAIDDVSDLFPISGAPVLAQSQANLKADRGNANFDVRHRLAASFVWNLPFYRNSKNGSARWLSGWQVSSIFQAQTGQPFTLNIPIDANLDGNVTDRPSTTDGLVFFGGHGRQRVSAAKPLETYFALGQDGVIGRNTLRGDSFINLDLALTKTFRFADTRKLDFRTELFNLFNRANFGLPVRILDAPGFGSSVDTVSPARMIQFALKLSF